MFPHQFPHLSTPRLLLRKVELSDAPTILFLRSDSTVTKYIERPDNRKTKTTEDTVNFIEMITQQFENRKTITWAITLQESQEMIGSICLWNFSDDSKTAEVGYDLHPHFHGKGIMTEAISQIIEFGFSILKLEKIEAFTHQHNAASVQLLLSNGFVLVDNRIDEDNLNNAIFEIIRD